MSIYGCGQRIRCDSGAAQLLVSTVTQRMWSAYTEQNPALRTCNSSTNAVYLNVLIVKLNSNLVINTVYGVLCNTVTQNYYYCSWKKMADDVSLADCITTGHLSVLSLPCQSALATNLTVRTVQLVNKATSSPQSSSQQQFMSHALPCTSQGHNLPTNTQHEARS